MVQVTNFSAEELYPHIKTMIEFLGKAEFSEPVKFVYPIACGEKVLKLETEFIPAGAGAGAISIVMASNGAVPMKMRAGGQLSTMYHADANIMKSNLGKLMGKISSFAASQLK